jgi:NAD(P)-dependent dehydrogenase (short-subunit alcohol dehydrogenase family)
MNKYYENKVAVVTGGASGIGLALCEMLLSFGAKAVIPADLNAEKLKTESARLETAYPGKVLGIKTDVTRQESVALMIRQAAEFGAGQIHFLFNNAGLGLAKSFDEMATALENRELERRQAEVEETNNHQWQHLVRVSRASRETYLAGKH